MIDGNTDNNQKIDYDKKRIEYSSRYRFWTERAIKQLSFENNLLLTVAIAALGYFWKEKPANYYILIKFDNSPNWPILFFVLGTIFVSVSIFFGFMLSLSRLYDMRLTRHILSLRQSAAKEKYLLADAELLDSNYVRQFYTMFKVFLNYRNYKIPKSYIESKNNNLTERFNKIRQYAKDFGDLSWCNLKIQAFAFLFGILFYAALIIIE